MLRDDGRLVDPVFGTRPLRPKATWTIEGPIPKRPNPKLESDAAHPDCFQHVYADRVFIACRDMVNSLIKHAAISVKLPQDYRGPLVSTYKVVSDTLDKRAHVIDRDDNAIRVPELYVGREITVDNGNIVTVLDLKTSEMYARDFIATPQPYRVATDPKASYGFTGEVKDPDEYRDECIGIASTMLTAAPASLLAGELTDQHLQGANLSVSIYGLPGKRDLDNAVLATMDVIQAAREAESGECELVDRLINSVHAVSMPGRQRVLIDLY